MLSLSYFKRTIALPGSRRTLPCSSIFTHSIDNSGRFNSGTIRFNVLIDSVPFVSIDIFVEVVLNQPHVAAKKDTISLIQFFTLL